MRRGLSVLIYAGLALGVYLWISQATLLTFEDENRHVVRLFLSTGFRALAFGCFAGPVALFALHLLLRQAASRHGATNPALLAPEDTAWARPLLFFWVSALTPLAALPVVGRPLSVLVFAIVDLRWWWTLVIAGVAAVEIFRKVYGSGSRERGPVHVSLFPPFRFAPEAALVAICAVWVIAGTPNLRFSASTHGDEPKYLRHCENLFQGHGLEISSLRPIADLPPDFGSHLTRNVRHIRKILPGELSELAADARRFLSDPSHPFTRSEKARGFLKGKTGGIYQVHQPGLSVLMMPAYYIDRHLTPPEPGSKAQWPPRLIAVNAFFLTLYLVWVVLIFHAARRLVPQTWIAWLTALTIGMTLPVAAFPFQIYPELAAGVLLFAIVGHLLFPTHATPVVAFVAGLLTGYLPWLHVRFSVLAAVLFITAVVKMRRDWRRLMSFTAGFVLPVMFLALYAYRLTGSVLPTAIWNERDGDSSLSVLGALRGSVAYLIDSQWGLLAHSPVYLLALPGYWLLAKQRRDVSWVCVMVLLSVLLPSAAHTLHGAATTPNRLIVAVVPFAALPIALCVAHYWRSRWFRAILAILLLVSLQNALTYNWWHIKEAGRMLDVSYSGWKVNLLFPAQSRTPWVVSNANGWLYVLWLAVLIGAVLAPALWARNAEKPEPALRTPVASASMQRVVLALTAFLILAATAIAAATGSWEKDDYRGLRTADARLAAASIDAAGGCALCLSSGSGRIGTDETFDNLIAIDPALGAVRKSRR